MYHFAYQVVAFNCIVVAHFFVRCRAIILSEQLTSSYKKGLLIMHIHKVGVAPGLVMLSLLQWGDFTGDYLYHVYVSALRMEDVCMQQT